MQLREKDGWASRPAEECHSGRVPLRAKRDVVALGTVALSRVGQWLLRALHPGVAGTRAAGRWRSGGVEKYRAEGCGLIVFSFGCSPRIVPPRGTGALARSGSSAGEPPNAPTRQGGAPGGNARNTERNRGTLRRRVERMAQGERWGEAQGEGQTGDEEREKRRALARGQSRRRISNCVSTEGGGPRAQGRGGGGRREERGEQRDAAEGRPQTHELNSGRRV